MCIKNSFLETCLETKCTLLHPFPDSIILAHIFIMLPLTLLMLWRLRRINKPWFLIVGKSVPWNGFEVIKINHKSYLRYVTTSHTPGQSFKMRFEGEFRTLQKFVELGDLVEPTPLSSSSDYKDNMYSSTHIPPTPQ